MPRKRQLAPKDYRRCQCCGALHPVKYTCGCSQSELVARVFALFPGTVEVDGYGVPLVQGNVSNSGDGIAPIRADSPLSRKPDA